MATYGRSGPPSLVETPESRDRTQLRAVTDRLSVETGCAHDKITLTAGSSYTVGMEQAYRFRACGADYVCTYNTGHVECKPAIAK